MGSTSETKVPIWSVPYRRNSFFTDQEKILTQLHRTLTANTTTGVAQHVTPQAISGLGGIGKTQIALEYAYRFGDEYQTVLWVQADSESLIVSYTALYSTLGFPEQSTHDQRLAIEAIKRWLDTHDQWLLIFDNADDLKLIDDFLPATPHGHILFTTRGQAYGSYAQGTTIEPMELVDGALLLLRRAKVLSLNAAFEQAPEADRSAALTLAQKLGGLPLALDQAGAYIEETRSSITGYLQRYQIQRITLLQRRGKLVKDHPESVVTTWSLSITKIEQTNRIAAELLRFCAFLSPDAIPEEIFTKEAEQLSMVLRVLANNLFVQAVRRLLFDLPLSLLDALFRRVEPLHLTFSCAHEFRNIQISSTAQLSKLLSFGEVQQYACKPLDRESRSHHNCHFFRFFAGQISTPTFAQYVPKHAG